MKVGFLRICVVSSLILWLMVGVGCSDEDGQRSCNVEYNVSAVINLSYPLYSDLQNPNGWAYVQGEGTGTRGIIVVNTGNGYKAYDRNAPHICPNAESTLEVVNGIKLYCPYDGAEWILLTGQPLVNEEGFAPDRTPRTYLVIPQGGSLFITNY